MKNNFLLNDFYLGKINYIVAFFKNKKELDFSNLDIVNNLIYKLTKCNFITIEDSSKGGYYSTKDSEIALSLTSGWSLREYPTIIFHEIGHHFQYSYGKDVHRIFFEDYLLFERQAEQFNVVLLKMLEKKFKIQLIPNNYVMSYYNESDVEYLKNFWRFK